MRFNLTHGNFSTSFIPSGYPMGPLELLDYVGLDTTKFILDGKPPCVDLISCPAGTPSGQVFDLKCQNNILLADH